MSVKPNLALTTAYARTHPEILPAPVRKVTREKLALVRVYKSTFKHWTSNLPMTETVRKTPKKRLKGEVNKCLHWSHGLAIAIHSHALRPIRLSNGATMDHNLGPVRPVMATQRSSCKRVHKPFQHPRLRISKQIKKRPDPSL